MEIAATSPVTTIGQLLHSMEEPSILFRVKVISASVTSLISLSYIDYLTGYQFLLFVFYFAPVALCGWYLGRLAWSSWQS